MEIADYNRQAWNQLVESGNRWTQPVTSEEVAVARKGEWRIVLTPTIPVPRDWFGEIEGKDVLCLASGGGQQGPLLAAAGARVTVFDNSPRQLQQDRFVADRDGLEIATVQGDMRSLNLLDDESFDLVINPCSISFVPNALPVWEEAYRVLRKRGRLMTGFINPVYFLFDYFQMQEGKLVVKHSIPYSDERDLATMDLQKLRDANEPLVFGHSLQDLLGGQLDAGFEINGFYEDQWCDGETALLDKYIKTFIATLAEKPGVDSTTT